jgi:hypothetical protein
LRSISDDPQGPLNAHHQIDEALYCGGAFPNDREKAERGP